jgi:hypothetical protein
MGRILIKFGENIHIITCTTCMIINYVRMLMFLTQKHEYVICVR